MAELNLSVVANHILRLLRSEDVKEVGSLWGVPQELLQGLDETVSMLTPLLLDAEEKSFYSEDIKKWLRRLGDELDDADNLLDEFFSVAISQRGGNNETNKILKEVRGFVSSLVTPYSRFSMINAIYERLKGIAAERIVLNLVKRSDKKILEVVSAGAVRGTARLSIVKEGVIMRDDDREAIVRILLDAKHMDRYDPMVLPIIGMGGLGKTTLARDVFTDERVKNYFSLRIWVGVSENFDIRKILELIIMFVTRESRRNIADFGLDRLIRLVRDLLRHERFLVVLDDVWNEDYDKWFRLKLVLRAVGARGSAIMLTSRLSRVAHIAGTTQPYELHGLSEEQSWTLFQRLAFGQDSQESKSYDRIRIGQEIVRRCRGHPLVITAIGVMLRFQNSEAEWRFFHEYDFGRRIEHYELSMLKLSYDCLPSPLKHCFAYCSLFPKDHEIDVQTLVRLWMAQGFIDPSTSNQSLEDVGYGYFVNLLHRYFFHQVTMDTKGRVTKCQMPELMHELAIYVAGNQCVLLNSPRTVGMIDGITFHVSFGSEVSLPEHLPASLEVAKKLRSILLPSKLLREDRGRPDDKIFDTIVSRCRFLRVLDMHALGIKKVPYSIGNLCHLRYLDLSENEYITKLPGSITKLVNLQTLRLSLCFELKRLPRDIGNLINLRHLEIDGCYNLVSLPRGIGKLTNLQTLSQLVVSEDASTRGDELNELKRLDNLKDEFEIKNMKHGKNNMAEAYLNVIRLRVRSLSLEWESHVPESKDKDTPLMSSLFSDLEELSLNGFWGVTLFSHGFSSNLVKLSLRRCMKCIELPPFSRCLKLKVLVLDEMTDLEYLENEPFSSSTIFFPALQELWLTELPKLRGWWKTSSLESRKLPSFPCLSKLVIEDCPNLASIPLFPTLEEGLVLDSTSWKPLQLTMEHGAKPTEDEASPSTSRSSPLSELKNLCIVGIRKFDDSEANEIEWKSLRSLQLLKFDSLPELTTLPKSLQQATGLRELHVWRCGVQELPTWIPQLKSLEKLVIRVCPRLETLPEEIRGLKCLKTLEIHDCPVLSRRCEKRIGADWDKISHIETQHLGLISIT